MIDVLLENGEDHQFTQISRLLQIEIREYSLHRREGHMKIISLCVCLRSKKHQFVPALPDEVLLRQLLYISSRQRHFIYLGMLCSEGGCHDIAWEVSSIQLFLQLFFLNGTTRLKMNFSSLVIVNCTPSIHARFCLFLVKGDSRWTAIDRLRKSFCFQLILYDS